MQKDGTHRVVYGTQLKDITGKVKMVAVGYGREAEDVVSLSVCSWVKVSQDWSFLSL
jgi:hypothetical protein